MGSNRVGRDYHKTERVIVHVREGFHSLSLELFSETLQPGSQRQTDHCRPHGVSPLDNAGAGDRAGVPGVHNIISFAI